MDFSKITVAVIGLGLMGGSFYREGGYNLLRGKCPDPPGKVLHLHVRT